MQIPVGQLEVIVDIPIECPKHFWDLSVRPVTACPYYLCVKNRDEQAYHVYMDLWAKRTPKEKAERTYENFVKLVNELQSDGGYDLAKAAKAPMTIYKGTRWLEDGHHRAAIICALFGPDCPVPVLELDKELPNDLNQCSNPCTD